MVVEHDFLTGDEKSGSNEQKLFMHEAQACANDR
jgi:hypothetical protein